MLGFTPQQVGAMTLWQMQACIDGYKAANGTEPEAKPPTADEFFDHVARLA